MTSLSEFNAEEFGRAILRRPTERDQQISIGASNLSNMCTRCLAEDMIGATEGDSPYWLGAVVGTAVHAYLEERNEDADTLPEQKVTIGTIPGYGVVRSTSDLFHRPSGTVVDWKTTTRQKLAYIKRAVQEQPDEFEVTKVAEARHKVSGYRNQCMLYGLGMENEGYDVNHVAIVFICRDGLGDQDIWGWTMDYDRELALKVWDRGVRLWAWLQEGHAPDELTGSEYCWPCSMRRENR